MPGSLMTDMSAFVYQSANFDRNPVRNLDAKEFRPSLAFGYSIVWETCLWVTSFIVK